MSSSSPRPMTSLLARYCVMAICPQSGYKCPPIPPGGGFKSESPKKIFLHASFLDKKGGLFGWELKVIPTVSKNPGSGEILRKVGRLLEGARMTCLLFFIDKNDFWLSGETADFLRVRRSSLDHSDATHLDKI